MPKEKDKLPDNCGGCGYHLAATSECRRHGPQPSTDKDNVLAFWNLTRETDRCSAGTTTKTITHCGDCLHWYQPGGQPLNPRFRQGLSAEWWADSGLCAAFPPGATIDKGRWVFWRVTHASAGCGDGEAVDLEPDE